MGHLNAMVSLRIRATNVADRVFFEAGLAFSIRRTAGKQLFNQT